MDVQPPHTIPSDEVPADLREWVAGSLGLPRQQSTLR